jgi:DNA-binding NarL/FixJ family response regulator
VTACTIADTAALTIIVEKIKVALVKKPSPVRRELKVLISRQPDMEVVGEFADSLELLINARQSDVVFLSLPHLETEPGICSHLLAEHPDVLVIGVTSDVRGAVLWRRSISREVLGNVTHKEIPKLIRKALENEHGSADTSIDSW